MYISGSFNKRPVSIPGNRDWSRTAAVPAAVYPNTNPNPNLNPNLNF